MREHRGEVVATDAWPAILDPETWRQVNAVLPAKERSGRPPKHLLVGGISRCGVCGLQLYSRPERGGITRYVCAQPPEHQGCGRISIRSGPLDAYVVGAVITALTGPRLAELLAGAGADQDQTVAAGLERDKAALLELSADYYQRREIDRETFSPPADLCRKPSRRPSGARPPCLPWRPGAGAPDQRGAGGGLGAVDARPAEDGAAVGAGLGGGLQGRAARPPVRCWSGEGGLPGLKDFG